MLKRFGKGFLIGAGAAGAYAGVSNIGAVETGSAGSDMSAWAYKLAPGAAAAVTGGVLALVLFHVKTSA